MSIEATQSPYELFRAWFDEAKASEPDNPDAMALATVDETGLPSVRMVLLKGFDERGFVFFTNLESHKGRDLRASGKAGLCFHWKSLARQVRADGPVTPVSDEEADAYFASRPRGSQIGAWASQQSRPMESKAELLGRVASFTAKFGVGRVPRPPFWSGFRIAPERIEFWRDGRFRLHDRLVYHRSGEGWTTEILYP